MSYAIVGFGAVGQALARMFARKGIEVAVASTHQPEALAPQANAIGPTTVPKTLKDALEADIVMLAVPYRQLAGMVPFAVLANLIAITPCALVIAVAVRRSWSR